MVVNFYTPKKTVNKDCMGSFGLGFDLGTGIAGMIGRAKKLGVNIPDMQTVLMATEYKKNGHQVVFNGKGDITLIASSINGYDGEQDGIAYGAMATVCPGLYSSVMNGFSVKDRFICPDWSLFDIKNYKYFPSLKKTPLVTMNASWGCKYACSYCPYHSYYGQWQPKPISNIRNELSYLVSIGVKSIVFRDPLFTADRENTIAILEELMAWRIGPHNCFCPYFEWACETRIEKVDFDLLDLMVKAGCKAIHFGIESADDAVLASVNRKNAPEERQKEIIDYCEKIGIKTSCFFILCFPKDTTDTCIKTIDHAIYLNPNTAEFFIAQPYPGTKLHDSVKLTKEYRDMNGYDLCYEHDSISEGVAAFLRNLAYKKFYLRWAWIKKFLHSLFWR